MDSSEDLEPNATVAPSRVLVVEDDPPIRRLLRAALGAGGYDVLEAATGAEGAALAASHNPDIVLIDLGLPDLDGTGLIRRLREWSATPILVLSARGLERDKVDALDAGADDYMTKPFGVAELLARMRAALRRSARVESAAGATEVDLPGGVHVDLARRRVTREGAEVHLTPLEFKLLSELLRHRGKVLTHRQLLHEVWGPGHGDRNHYVRIFIHQLRRKLESDPTRPRLISGEPGVGYRLAE